MKIQTLHPDPGKKGVNIDKDKYDPMRNTILQLLKENGEMRATGLRPVFTPKLEVVGFKLGAEIFGAV